MSFPRCALLWARLPTGRQAGHLAAVCSALRPHFGPFPGALGRVPAVATASSSASGGSKAPNTSLFVPLTVKPQGPSADGDVGAELTRPLDKNEVKKILDKFYKRKEIQKLGADYGLDARLFHQAFISFRNYIMQSYSLDVDIHIVLNDICFSAAHVDDLFPFFLRHAKQIFPVLECKDDLRKISDLRIPPNWYPEARAIQRKIIFHSGPTNSGKTYHAIQKYLSAKSGVYCGPLKLLAHEIFEKSNAAFAFTGLCAEEVHLCGESAAIDLVTELMYTTGEEVEVRSYERLTPISVLDHALESLDNLRPGDCVVCFSKNDIYSVSRQIEIRGLESAVIYGSLPPVMQGFSCNLWDHFYFCFRSIRRIIFYSLIKPSINEKGEREIEPITTSQALQIAGRAGRYSTQFKEGEVTTMNREDLSLLKEILNRPVDPIRGTTLSNTPSDHRNEPLTFAWLRRYIKWPLLPPKNIKDLMDLEAVHDVLDLYLWLSYRFMDMFPDASLVRHLQKELDGIIQDGVHNITKLIKISETHKLLNLQSLSTVSQSRLSETLKSHARRTRGTKRESKAAEPPSRDAGERSLASRLVRQGLLTPDMLKQLEEEWLTQQTEQGKERTDSGTYSKGTRRKKKEPDSE
ncbi:PREDICTED: ATP-dependent RNA helicase SUPV3L1, mitochondrial [Propithecus coquereli]|uniref:ATP-dependent RNA helicase SUPV3L1, mitochondrial n=1 Tax=Propithecus coquereli TaxID=379532 RepID=UPI00063F4B3E|nr:PREDICTED: ATP-dependent RNA helicase SUPV3L1, mitochondrial [Propithecus coquereli]